MTVRQQWMVVGAVVVALVGGALAASWYLGDELFRVSVGSPAPSFEARTVMEAEPRTKTVADYRGEVVLLNIWATWCIPCRTEMPSFQRLHEELAPEGLRVVAVSVDDRGARDAIREFVDEMELTFEILHDERGAIQRQYHTTGVPETFMIGRDGVIRRKVIGAIEWDTESNRAIVRQLLAESAR